MATNLSSNNYVGEIPKVGDCVCVRGHKPIAMGELLAMSRSGPAGPTHAAQAPGHVGLGARPWHRRERDRPHVNRRRHIFYSVRGVAS